MRRARLLAVTLPFALAATFLATACGGERGHPETVRGDAGVLAPSAASAPSSLTLRVLDVSDSRVGGLAVLVTDSSDGRARHILIDGGEQRETAARALRALGVDSLALVVLTHPHTDHFNGLRSVLRRHRVAAFAWNGDARTLDSYRLLLRQVDASGARPLVVSRSDREITQVTGTDTLRITLLAPAPPLAGGARRGAGESSRINNRSVGVLLRYGAFSALVPGDAEHHQLRHWTRRLGGALDVDVLVASHHGARDANSTDRNRDWYRIVTPEALLIGANGRQHPYPEVLAHARSQRIPVYCTHTHGSVAARATRDGAFVVRADRSAECTAGAELPR
jgi:competence protein ComEC